MIDEITADIIPAMITRGGSFIDGKWRVAVNPSYGDLTDPATGRVFVTTAQATVHDVAMAARTASRAFPMWRETPVARRAQILYSIADRLEAWRSCAEAIIMRNNGKPYLEASMDVTDAISVFRYYAELIETVGIGSSARIDLPDSQFSGEARRVPLGPIGMIVAWNFPLVTAAWKMAPALACGCTVVLKPSELSPLADCLYGEISREAGLPDGVLNIVTGGPEIGQALTERPELAKISFTGSNCVGKHIMGAIASRLLPATMELGGKSSIIVLDGSDVETAAEIVAGGIFFNCGQMCSATSRVLVARPLLPALMDCLVVHAERLRSTLGRPDAGMGPISNEIQYIKTRAAMDDIRQDQLDVATCMDLPELAKQRGGFYVPPVIVREPPVTHPIWTRELFSPFMAVHGFNTVEDAVRMANDTPFGLAGSVIGPDGNLARMVGRQLRAGHVWVNTPQVIFPQSCWGGFGQSGIGRELGIWGLEACTSLQFITSSV